MVHGTTKFTYENRHGFGIGCLLQSKVKVITTTGDKL